MNKVRDALTPGTSALFTLSPDAAIDEIKEAIDGDDHRLEILTTHVVLGEEAALYDLFCA